MGENWRAFVLTVAVVCLVALVAGAGPVQAQPDRRAPAGTVYLDEDFEGTFPPSGWTRDNAGTCNWESSATTGMANNLTGGTGLFADANSDWCEDYMNAELWTPPLDLTAATNPVLVFRTYFLGAQYSDNAFVEVSTDGGTDWTLLVHYAAINVGPNHTQVVNLGAYAGQPSVIVRFLYAAPDWNWWWQIDDVLIADMTTQVYLPLVQRAFVTR